MMAMLLWKDARVNRTVLLFAVGALVLPFVLGIGRNLYHEWRFDQPLWSRFFWEIIAAFSLTLSLFTCAMLGGNAVAAERSDRSAEFMAYLPPSRAMRITSKAILALGTVAVIWAVNLVVINGIAPRAELAEEAAQRAAQAGDYAQMVTVLGGTSVLLLGAGWFWSCCLSSHALAAGMAIVTLAVLGFGLSSIDYSFEIQGLMENWFAPLGYVVGAVGFVAGTAYYLRRVEP